jgi:hypothetical protein
MAATEIETQRPKDNCAGKRKLRPSQLCALRLIDSESNRSANRCKQEVNIPLLRVAMLPIYLNLMFGCHSVYKSLTVIDGLTGPYYQKY